MTIPMKQASSAILGLCHRIAYASVIAGAVWLFYSIPFDGPLTGASKALLKLVDFPIATASQLLPCNARGVDLWYRIGPGESACPHYTTMSESLSSHMLVGVPAYVLLFYLPNLLLVAHRRLRSQQVSSPAIAAALSFAAFAFPVFAEARGPSTPEERSQAVALVHALEADPLNDGARDARGWLIAWLSEVPDITVQMCPALLGKGFESNRKYGAELSVQQALSSAAFVIEQPERAQDQLAVAVAGVEGVLRTYQALLSRNPRARFRSLDVLGEAEAKGALERIVADNLKACD